MENNYKNYAKFIEFHCMENNMENMFPEGINNQQIVEITGESGTGKTSFCIYLAVNFLLSHKNKGVLFISTTKQISYVRLSQIVKFHCENYGYNELDLRERFHDITLNYDSYEDQYRSLESTIQREKIGMIVIDTFTSLCKFDEDSGKSLPGQKTQFILDNLALFKNFIKNYQIIIRKIKNIEKIIKRIQGKWIDKSNLLQHYRKRTD